MKARALHNTRVTDLSRRSDGNVFLGAYLSPSPMELQSEMRKPRSRTGLTRKRGGIHKFQATSRCTRWG